MLCKQQNKIMLDIKINLDSPAVTQMKKKYKRKSLKLKSNTNYTTPQKKQIRPNSVKYSSMRQYTDEPLLPIISSKNSQKYKHFDLQPQDDPKPSYYHPHYEDYTQQMKFMKILKKSQSQICQRVQQFNPLFRKMDSLTIECLFKLGKIIFLEEGKSLYTEGNPCKYLYFLICGKVATFSHQNNEKNYAITGSSLCEHAIFQMINIDGRNTKNSFVCHNQTAETLTSVSLLKLKLRKYLSLEEELSKNGLRHQFLQLHNLLKSQYLHKKLTKNLYLKKMIKKDSSSHLKHQIKQFSMFLY